MADLVTATTSRYTAPAPQETISAVSPANIDVRSHSGAVAGEIVDAGQPVFLHTDGRYYLCDADTANAAASGATLATSRQFAGVAAKRANAGQPITVVYDGHMGGFTGLIPGAKYYVSNTKGGITDTAPTNVAVIGYALTAQVMLVRGFQY